MKWLKVEQGTNEPAKKGNSFIPHDYISGEYRIINKSFVVSKQGWILTKNGEEVGRYNTLKAAKAAAE